MDPSEALFDPIGIPRQVVVDHQMGALKVDAFAGRVCRDEDLHLWVVLKRFLGFHAFLATQASVDDYHGLFTSEQRGDAGFEVGERVAVLSENDKLLTWRRLGRRDGRGTVGGGLLSRMGGGPEDLAEQAREFAPFAVFAATADRERERFKAAEGSDFRFELSDRAGRRSLIEDFFFCSLYFAIGRVLEILHVLGIQRRRSGGDGFSGGAALQQFELSESLL